MLKSLRQEFITTKNCLIGRRTSDLREELEPHRQWIYGMDSWLRSKVLLLSVVNKIDATYLSPHVNMASMMMSATKHNVTILLSQAVGGSSCQPARSKLRHLDTVTVGGRCRAADFAITMLDTRASIFFPRAVSEQAVSKQTRTTRLFRK
jgi:hypothetical protein